MTVLWGNGEKFQKRRSFMARFCLTDTDCAFLWGNCGDRNDLFRRTLLRTHETFNAGPALGRQF